MRVAVEELRPQMHQPQQFLDARRDLAPSACRAPAAARSAARARSCAGAAMPAGPGTRSAGCAASDAWPRGRSVNRLVPLNSHAPAVGSVRRRMQRPVVLLPQPLSPTSASVSPACSVEADAADRVQHAGLAALAADVELLHQVGRPAAGARSSRAPSHRDAATEQRDHRARRARHRCAPARLVDAHDVDRARAARRERAAGRQIDRVRRRATDGADRTFCRSSRGRQSSNAVEYGCCGSGEQVEHRAAFHDAACVHHRHAVGAAGHDAEVVGDEHAARGSSPRAGRGAAP